MGRIRHFVREASITLTLALGVFLGVQAWLTRATPPQWAPQGTLTWLLPDGTVQHGTWADLRAQMGTPAGQVLALHVWAPWCGFCRAEESAVTALASRHPVITLATRSGDAASVRAYLRQRGLPWVTVLDPDGGLAAAHGWHSVPVFAVLDAGDRLRHVTVGYTTGWGMRWRLHWVREHDRWTP
ncbi:MAG: protein disulfide oxidoreductase [Tepidimonas sp.]|uniref:redoxin family protein n=1 Tax=Tepidimonas sp. TaxID=2002775 RepID=UPI00298F09DA|nr:redoxin family protein [Tepidimonas sp.]MDW8337503.1 protein disulfide oxidoreductase [Tepidimonas sp.]